MQRKHKQNKPNGATRAKAKLSAKQFPKTEKIFLQVQKRAAKEHPIAAAFCLHAKTDIHTSPRSFAQSLNGDIFVAPEIEGLKRSKIEGIMMHEFGHLLIEAGELPDASLRAGYDSHERAADRAAEQVFGKAIYYDTRGIEDTAFSTSFKRPRPPGLR